MAGFLIVQIISLVLIRKFQIRRSHSWVWLKLYLSLGLLLGVGEGAYDSIWGLLFLF